MSSSFFIGTQVRMRGLLLDVDDVATTGTVVCEVKDPSGNITTPATSTPETGTYYAYVTVDEAGTWYYRFESTGSTIAASESSFYVEVSQF